MEEATKQSSKLKADNRAIRNDLILFRNDPDCSIAERLSPKDCDINNDPVRNVEALCIHVEPRACSRVVKQLSSTLPLEDRLSHLKRVRKCLLPQANPPDLTPKSVTLTDSKVPNENTSSSLSKNDCSNHTPVADSKPSNTSDRPKKRKQPNFVLEILIGTPSQLNLGNHTSNEEHPIVREFGPLHPVMVPKYEPRSEKEWKEHNTLWPTLYHPLKFEEHKRRQLALSEFELNRMKKLMDRCISTQSVLIVDPDDSKSKKSSTSNDGNSEIKNGNKDTNIGIVSISEVERSLQDQLSEKNQRASLLGNNPLTTPILLALQGVSRREREAKLRGGGDANIDDCSKEIGSVQNQREQTQRVQYICTGYDMYSFYEPNVFEAMACLHSRLRRLIYFVPDPKDRNREGRNVIDSVAWRCGLSKHDVHNLAGTNHNYRAFEYRQSSYLP